MSVQIKRQLLEALDQADRAAMFCVSGMLPLALPGVADLGQIAQVRKMLAWLDRLA